MSTIHRPGNLKQSNKPHNSGRHRSKGMIHAEAKGKPGLKIKMKPAKKCEKSHEKLNRIKQIRQDKVKKTAIQKQLLGTGNSAPFLVCVLALSENVDPLKVVAMAQNAEPESEIVIFNYKYHHFNLKRFKQIFTFFIPDKHTPFAFLDALKVADTLLLVTSVANGIDEDQIISEESHCLLQAACNQGLPSTSVVVMDLEQIPQKKRNNCKEIINELIEEYIPKEKVLPLSSDSDALNLLRKISNEKKKVLQNRAKRSYMLVEGSEFQKVTENTGSLIVTGYVRNRNLPVNRLVHIVGLGDYQIEKITIMHDPFKMKKRNSEKTCSEEMKSEIYPDLSLQENLIAERDLDEMDVDQIWPTEEEMKEAEIQQKIKNVPEGWSNYQAAWIIDDDAESMLNESIESSESDMSDNECELLSYKSDSENDVYNDAESINETQSKVTETEIDDNKYDKMNDYDDEKRQLVLIREAKDALMFPDEIDTPFDIAARVRFQKYRHLESFRTSAWDVKENLPRDFARIFQFKNFNHTRNRVMKSLKKEDVGEPVSVGCLVNVTLKNVRIDDFEQFQRSHETFVLIGMLPHEHKTSLMNIVIKRNSNYELPIQSKESLLVQCGYRRMMVKPLFSQHTNGNKFKYEKYFNVGETKVASFYAPIQYPPATVLVFKQIEDDSILIANGSLLSCNPDRMIIKRIVLSGHPFKINKRSCVVRFMFFNPEDIKYYKPCELKTKCGRVGHIKEPLGTHGHMKCVFNSQLKSHDTVLLYLYKRVFPKWTSS